MLDGEWVKLLVMGHSSEAGHTHEDKGSFVLEFAGETFALDLGTCSYTDPIHHQYRFCQRHNMLVPVGMPERAHPLCPLPMDVKPTGQGDETAFTARIDASPGWQGYYKRWVRTWESPSPDVIVIRDEYEVGKGTGVEFYWQTRLPVDVEGGAVRIRGKRGEAVVSVPEDCTVRLDTLPLMGGASYTRIAIVRGQPSGTLEVRVALRPLGV